MKDKIQYGKLLKEYKMERLTQKNDFFGYELPCQNAMGDTQAGEITIGDSEYTAKKFIVGEAIRQFGLIEDVLEKHNIESIESLDLILQGIKKTWQESADAKKLTIEKLKKELAKVKEQLSIYKIKDTMDLAGFINKNSKKLAIKELKKAKMEFETYYADCLHDYPEYLEDRIEKLKGETK